LRYELEVAKTKFTAHLGKLEEKLAKAVGFEEYASWDRASSFVLDLHAEIEAARK